MKLWPTKLWKQILVVLAIVFIILIVVFAAFAGLLMAGIIGGEVVSEVKIMNTDGLKTALVVYQPGFSNFPKDVSYAFADGLVSSNWQVEITTASPQTPSELSKYSLLVLAYPVYGGTPGSAIVKYVDRVGNLNGINTIIIACAGGDSGESIIPLRQQVEEANGVFFISMALSNQVGSSTEEARQAGSNIDP
jgi:hypothetical protein